MDGAIQPMGAGGQMSLFGQLDALRALQDQLATATTADGEPIVGRAESDDGRVEAEVTDGKISKLALTARALKDMTNVELADVIVETTNAALADYLEARSQVGPAATFEAALASIDAIAADAEASFNRGVAELDHALDSVEALAAQQQAEQARRDRQG